MSNLEEDRKSAERILCRWAEAKYELKNVTRVCFDVGAHGPYSEETPDIDPYVEICVYVKGDVRPRIYEWVPYQTNLINEIVRFARDA